MKFGEFVPLLVCVSAISLTSCRSQSSENDVATEDRSRTRNETQNNQSNNSNEEASTPEDSLDALARRLLTAIQENDIDKFHACWPRIQDLEALVRNPPPDMPVQSEERFNQMRGYLSERDELVRFVFPWLRRAVIDKCGDLGILEVVDVRGNVSVHDGYKNANSIVVVLSTPDDREVNYHVDLAVVAVVPPQANAVELLVPNTCSGHTRSRCGAISPYPPSRNCAHSELGGLRRPSSTFPSRVSCRSLPSATRERW